MAQRPNSYLNWTPDGSPTKVVQPPANLANQGWLPGMAPPPQYMNWLFYYTDLWIQYLDQLITEGVPDQAMRLLDGGYWSFDKDTGALAWSAPFIIAIPSVPDASNTVPTGSIVIPDGYVAYVDLNNPMVVLGDTHNGTNVVDNISIIDGINTGMAISGPGIPSGTTVLSVGSDSVTISNNATADGTQVTITFAGAGPLTAHVAQSGTFAPQYNQILFARRDGDVVYVGVNASQMLMRDGEFKPLLGSGYFDVYTATAGENLTAGQLVYISPGPSDSGRTAGALYKLDVSATYQSVRGTFAGLVISDFNTSDTAIVVFSGFYSYSGLTAGLDYYADPATPGGITAVQPSALGQKIVPVGFASGSSSLLVTGIGAASQPVQAYAYFYQELVGVGNGTNTSFPLTQPVLNASSLFVFTDGGILPQSQWSLSGSTLTITSAPAIGVRVYVSYVLANQVVVAGMQEPPQPVSGSSTHFKLTGTPTNPAGFQAYINGEILESSEYNLSQVLGVTYIDLVVALAPAQNLYCTYFVPVGGSIVGAQNLGNGVGLYDSVLAAVLRFKSLKAGSNVSVVDNMDGTVTIAATGSGGGVETHGSAVSPIPIDPTVGIVPTTAEDQIWWVQPNAGSGQIPITATPPIAPGTMVGQRLTLKSVASANYLKIPLVSGVDQNGDIDFGVVAGDVAQAVQYTWDDNNWSEDFRRV